jgi:hypothetical protein
MAAPQSPWSHASSHPLPPIRDRHQLKAHLDKLFSDENMARLKKMLKADPRLIAFVRELSKKGGE